MPEPAAPFAVDPGTAVHAHASAEPAARNAPDPRPERSAANLDLTPLGVAGEKASRVEESDPTALLEPIDALLVAEHGSPGAFATVRPLAGARPYPGS